MLIDSISIRGTHGGTRFDVQLREHPEEPETLTGWLAFGDIDNPDSWSYCKFALRVVGDRPTIYKYNGKPMPPDSPRFTKWSPLVLAIVDIVRSGGE